MIGLELKSFKAVVFDLFHTLTSLESSRAAGPGTSEILGVPRAAWNDQLLVHSEDRLRGRIKDPYEIIRIMARAINPQISDEVIREATDNRIIRFRHALANIEPDVIETLVRLKDRGKSVGLISNADVNEIVGWDDSPLRRYFDSTVFSCYVGYIKPEKEIYEVCLKELKVSAQETLYAGDGSCDELRGAKELGMMTVLVTYVIRNIWPEKIPERRKYADLEINRLSELIK